MSMNLRPMLLKDIKPGFWILTGTGHVACLSSSPRCPTCGTPNWCENHEYVYLNWWVGMIRALSDKQGSPTQSVPAFFTREQAIAARELLRKTGRERT